MNLIALLETRDYKTNNFSATGKDIPFKELPELGFATQIADNPVGGGSNANRRVGFAFRGQYNYADKYLAEFSGRYDGSYKFFGNVGGKRWGFFPSVSLGWRISEEEFFSSLRGAVDNLKLRASFGSLGDDAGSSAYFYVSRSWQDVNEDDFQILKNTDICCAEYSEEEKLFLQEQKQKLLQEFEKQLKLKK